MKTIATAVLSALIGYGMGTVVSNAWNKCMVGAAENFEERDMIKGLTEENRRMENELRRLNDIAEDTKSTIARTPARATTLEEAGRRARIIGLPLQQYEIREQVMQNLRQLAGAQDQYKLEHGRWPTSIHDLVGRNNYIHGVLPVDGENYAGLSWGGLTFKLTTESGLTIAYANDEPVDADAAEFRIEYPPEVIRVRELEAKLARPKQTATEAYRMAHQGKNPSDEKALIGFFGDSNDGADFVEYLEAKKAMPE